MKSFIEQSHPENHEAEASAPEFNPQLRQQLHIVSIERELSVSKLARKLGYSESVVSQYLNRDKDDNTSLNPAGCKYTGDVGALERRVLDFLQNEARRRAGDIESVDCEIAQQMVSAFEYTRRTNGVSEILGESGEGKTRGLQLYQQQNTTCIIYRVRAWSIDKRSVEISLWNAVGKAGWDRQTKPIEFVINKLRGSDRLLIVDDCHKLRKPALGLLFDLHDETLCPMALCGLYELSDKLNEDPQRSRRVGLHFELKSKNPRALIKEMIKQSCPEVNGETGQLTDLCEGVAEMSGRYGNVHQQLKMAAELRSHNKKLNWCQAFAAAATFMPHRPKQEN